MSNDRITAILLITGAILANIAFAGLGELFNYPDILQAHPSLILREFAAREGAIVQLFALLALSAALIAPIAIRIDRLSGATRLTTTAWVGIAAAAVQVIGLMRWIIIVPGLSAPEDIETFERLHTILGTIIGETFGYALTSLWTILVIRSLGNAFAGRWFLLLGYVSAGLIAAGVLVPLGFAMVDLANFVGYVLWSVWLIAFGIVLWRRADAA